MGYRGIPGLSTQIKNSYTRVILPFEHYCDRGRNSPTLAQTVTRDGERMQVSEEPDVNPLRLSTAATLGQEDSPRGSPSTARSSPLSEPPDESETKDRNGKSSSTRLRRSSRMSFPEQSALLFFPKLCATNLTYSSAKETNTARRSCTTSDAYLL